jgi:hypothetical protein
MTYREHPYVSNSDLSNSIARPVFGNSEKAFAFGTLVHASILEPHRINYDKKTLDGEPVDGFGYLGNMASAFFNNAFCAEFRARCTYEVEMFKENIRFEYNGKKFAMHCKCKYDLWNGQFGGDIKTTSAETEQEFLKNIETFDYARARVFYSKISGAERDVIIGISKKNYKVFLVFMKKGDYLWQKGEERLNEIAFNYWNNNLQF